MVFLGCCNKDYSGSYFQISEKFMWIEYSIQLSITHQSLEREMSNLFTRMMIQNQQKQHAYLPIKPQVQFISVNSSLLYGRVCCYTCLVIIYHIVLSWFVYNLFERYQKSSHQYRALGNDDTDGKYFLFTSQWSI